MASKTGISVQITGKDGNAFLILGLVTRAMKNGGVPKETIDKYREEAMIGDYNHLLQVTMEYVDVE